MKIDAFTHILPEDYYARASKISSESAANLQKRIGGIPTLYNLEERWRIMDRFTDYVQVITLATPPIETLGEPAVATELAQLANDGMAALVDKYPDRFVGFVASLPMNDVGSAVEEIDRAVNELSALGVQIFTNVNGAPLDDPRFDPIFAKMAEVERTIWVHPYRNEKWPDYPTEPKSRYELWWVFGWPYETSVLMARLALSGLFDRYPNLRILTHHGGAMAPYFAGRIGPGLDQLGTRTPDEDLTSVTRELEKRPFDYFKMFYADTALFGAPHALECAVKFFGADRVLFASDMPFDPENGALYIPSTISDVDALQIDESERQKIYEGNAQRVLGVRLP